MSVVAADLIAQCDSNLSLHFDLIEVRVHSNEPRLLSELSDYYKSYPKLGQAEQTIDLYAVEANIAEIDLDWQVVDRETGKSGLKESYSDTAEGRWIWKHKTGMKMLQRVSQPIAVGPCRENLAQVINFINNQFLNHFQRLDYMLGHAAAFSDDGDVTAVAASSGGGKSTLMLAFLEHVQNAFLTNDRLLFKRIDTGVEAIGLAKMPRVNPGTLLYSKRLNHLLSDSFKAELNQLETRELWELEHKFDVQIEEEYGPERVALKGRFKRLLLLDWELNTTEPTQVVAVDVEADPRSLAGLQKRRGPFYHDATGHFPFPDSAEPLARYVDQLQGVEVYRITGAVNFAAAVEAYYQVIS